MHIRDISIDGFGIFHNLAMEELHPGLTLFEGQNEAGKSTLMSFIRAVLFGFEGRKSGNNRYEPLRGGRHGGALTVKTPEGAIYRIERFEGGAQGRVKVFDEEGRAHDEALLQQLLHGTSKALYQNVFAFGLTELQRLDTLQAEEVSHHIYTAGLGTGSVPFTDVMSRLEEEQGQLFKPGGKKPMINSLLARLDQTQRQIQDLQAIPDEYYSVTDQISTIGCEILTVQQQLERTKSRADWLQTALKARPDWEQLMVVRRELGELLGLADFPEGGVERLDQLNGALATLETRHDDTVRAIRDLEERRDKLCPDPRLLHQADHIQPLAEDREHLRKLLEHMPTLRAKVEARRKALDDILTRLGPMWDDDRLAKFDASIPMRERIRGFRDQMATAKAQWGEAVKRLEETNRIKRAKEAEIDRLQRNHDGLVGSEVASLAPVEERDKALRQWTHHYHQLDLLAQHQRDAKYLRSSLAEQIRGQAAQLKNLESGGGLPLWVIVLGGLLCIGVAALASHFGFWEVGAGLVVLGIIAAGLVLWWRDRKQNKRQIRLNEFRRQYQLLAARADELEREGRTLESDKARLATDMTALARYAAGRELTSLAEVDEALAALEGERRTLERRQDLEARIHEEEEILVGLLEEQQTLNGIVGDKQHAYSEVKEAWISLLKTLEIDEGLTPDGALEVLATVEGAKLQLREWQETRHALEHGEEEIRSMGEQVNDVLQKCEWAPVTLSDTPAALLALRKSLGETLTGQHELERLTEQLADKQAELESTEAERDRVRSQRDALLSVAEARDGDDFRRRAASYKRQVELERRARQLEVALEAHAGSPERYQDLEELLVTTSLAQLERELSEAGNGEFERLRHALTNRLQDKGRLEQRLQGLEQNQRLSDTLLEYQSLLAQLDQHVQRWAIRGVTHFLLDKARQVYERERQPAVLKQASDFFRVMTRGRYRRVIVPLGETRLEVESKSGRAKDTERLSRGTAEQLYLSMRLALVREYAKHAGALPLVIDDILVNFDPQRARAAIEVLKDIAQSHQVLFFTCHPHVIDWFEESMPGVPVRPLA